MELTEDMEAEAKGNADIERQLPGALRALLALSSGSPDRSYGIAATEILRAAHRKTGTIETRNLASLDPQNRHAAMVVIEAIARRWILSDRGLEFYGNGDPLLSAVEVELIA